VADVILAPMTVAAIQAEPVPGDVAGNADSPPTWWRRLPRRGHGCRTAGAFPAAYHPPTLAADRPARTSPPTRMGGSPTRGWTRCAKRPALTRWGGHRRLGAAPGRPPDLLLRGDRPGRCGHCRLQQAASVGSGRERPVHARGSWRDPGRGRLAVRAGVCYEAASPSTAGPRQATACTATYARAAIWAARTTAATSITRPAPWTTPCTWSSPIAVGGPPGWQFNGGAAVYDPEGRRLARGANTGEAVVLAGSIPMS